MMSKEIDVVFPFRRFPRSYPLRSGSLRSVIMRYVPFLNISGNNVFFLVFIFFFCPQIPCRDSPSDSKAGGRGGAKRQTPAMALQAGVSLSQIGNQGSIVKVIDPSPGTMGTPKSLFPSGSRIITFSSTFPPATI